MLQRKNKDKSFQYFNNSKGDQMVAIKLTMLEVVRDFWRKGENYKGFKYQYLMTMLTKIKDLISKT